MKHISNILCIGALSVMAALAGCQREVYQGEAGSGDPAAVLFTSNVARASYEGSWSANDPVGIFMMAAGDTIADAGNRIGDNVLYRSAINGLLSPGSAEQTVYFPVDGSEVDFVAYYPYSADLNNLQLKIDLNDQSTDAKRVLLFSNNASGVSYTPGDDPVAMTFEHQYARIKVEVTPGIGFTAEDLADNLSIAITNVADTAVFFLADTSFRNVAAPAKTLAFSKGTPENEWNVSLIPGQEEGEGRQLRFSYPSLNLESFDLPDGKVYERGKVYTYKARISRNGLTVSEGDIMDWDVEEVPGTTRNAPTLTTGVSGGPGITDIAATSAKVNYNLANPHAVQLPNVKTSYGVKKAADDDFTLVPAALGFPLGAGVDQNLTITMSNLDPDTDYDAFGWVTVDGVGYTTDTLRFKTLSIP